jgi:hypothetical protein
MQFLLKVLPLPLPLPPPLLLLLLLLLWLWLPGRVTKCAPVILCTQYVLPS